MSDYWKIFVCVGMLVSGGVAFAGQGPLAVSPGDPQRLLLVEARCPTFNWAAVDGAESYELIVYEVDERGEKAESVLQQILPGAVSGWTPSLDRCLARAGRYAWSVRAVGLEGITEWSTASLFQVAPAPNELVLEQALEIVRRQLAAEAESTGLSKADVLRERGVDAPTREAGGGDREARARAASVELLVSDGDIAVSSADTAYAHSYVQLDTIFDDEPPGWSCNEESEYGRLIYRYTDNYLYVCDESGWVDLNCSFPPC